MPERTLAIRVDEELYRKVKLRLAEKDITLKDYLVSLIEKDLENMDMIEGESETINFTVSMEELWGFLRDREKKNK